MTVPSSHCEAKKHAYRQTQDGIVVSFVLHPDEVPADLALAALGTRYMLALARIGDDEEPQEPEKPKRPGTRFADMPRSQQAGIRCKDAAFQQWARSLGWVCNDEKTTRAFVLNQCAVSARRELDYDISDNISAQRWDDLLMKFRADTGRTAEQRG